MRLTESARSHTVGGNGALEMVAGVCKVVSPQGEPASVRSTDPTEILMVDSIYKIEQRLILPVSIRMDQGSNLTQNSRCDSKLVWQEFTLHAPQVGLEVAKAYEAMYANVLRGLS